MSSLLAFIWWLGVQIFCLINCAPLHAPLIKLAQLDSLIKWDNSDFNTHVKIPFFFFFVFFSLFPAFGFFLVWGSKLQTLMARRLDFSNRWAKDTCKGNLVAITMENPNFSVVVLKKISSHHSSNRKGERDPREGKAQERERERNHLCPPPPLVFVPTANNMQPRWVRTQNCFFFFF